MNQVNKDMPGGSSFPAPGDHPQNRPILVQLPPEFLSSWMSCRQRDRRGRLSTHPVLKRAVHANRVRQLGFEPGLAAASTQAKPRSPTRVPRGRGGSGLATPETETAEECPGPDRFKAT